MILYKVINKLYLKWTEYNLYDFRNVRGMTVLVNSVSGDNCVRTGWGNSVIYICLPLWHVSDSLV